MKEQNNAQNQLSIKDHISKFAPYAELDYQECMVLIALDGSYIEDLEEDRLYNNYINAINWLKNLSFDAFTMYLNDFTNNASIAKLAGYSNFNDLILAKENDERNIKILDIIKKACKAKKNYKFVD